MNILKDYIEKARTEKRAIAHFNVSDSHMLMGIFKAAQKVSEELGEKIPIIIGVSEGERDAFGTTQFVDYILSLQNEYDYPIFSGADHTYSVERSCEALDAGFDIVVYDGAHLSFEENLENTKQVVHYRNEIDSPALIEAEFGFIGAGSNIKDSIPEGVSASTMTTPEDALAFVKESGIDALAPSVGNIHGMVKSGNPALNAERVSAIYDAIHTPLVLHGGSGSTDEDFVSVIKAGISIIHISTELRIAYRKALEETLTAEPEQLVPYKYFIPAEEAIAQVAEDRIRLFWGKK